MTLEDDDTLLTAALADVQRLHAVERTALLDSPAERTFDRLTALVCRELGVPVSLVSLVTADRQFFKSQCGLPAPYGELRQTPLSHSFCQYVVAGNAPLLVEDAREDPKLRTNHAIEDLGVVAYAGVPLLDPAGRPLGALCAIDHQPREWTREDLAKLAEIAEQASHQIGEDLAR
jgi:GAF domain-containing protein